MIDLKELLREAYGLGRIGWSTPDEDLAPLFSAADRLLSATPQLDGMGWRAMDTAPKDEPILMLMKHGAIQGTWDGKTGGGYYWHDLEWFATHWMPLPAPPAQPPAAGLPTGSGEAGATFDHTLVGLRGETVGVVTAGEAG